METGFCLAAIEVAFRFGQPEIWNPDHGWQFTSADFLAPLKDRHISIRMDGRGRAMDLTLFFRRMDGFFFLGFSTCRTIEGLIA
jgi:putative transposase